MLANLVSLANSTAAPHSGSQIGIQHITTQPFAFPGPRRSHQTVQRPDNQTQRVTALHRSWNHHSYIDMVKQTPAEGRNPQ